MIQHTEDHLLQYNVNNSTIVEYSRTIVYMALVPHEKSGFLTFGMCVLLYLCCRSLSSPWCFPFVSESVVKVLVSTVCNALSTKWEGGMMLIMWRWRIWHLCWGNALNHFPPSHTYSLIVMKVCTNHRVDVYVCSTPVSYLSFQWR